MYKKLLLAALAAVTALGRKCEIKELGENGFDVEAMQDSTESVRFTFASFYHPKKKSQHYADSLLQGACDMIEAKMESGEWAQRDI